jgi:hypothetical protein
MVVSSLLSTSLIMVPTMVPYRPPNIKYWVRRDPFLVCSMWEFILTNLSCHESKLDENNRSRPAGRGGCPLSANADGNVDGGDDGGGERET